MKYVNLKNTDKTEVLLIGGIKGLISDGNELKDKLYEFIPHIMLIGISPGEVEGLTKFIEDPFELDLNDYEIIYGTLLSRFGEVMVPPPIYIEAIRYSVSREIPAKGLDAAEDEFGSKYSETFTTGNMVSYIMRKKRIMKKPFSEDNPEDFVMSWKNEMDKNKGNKKMDDFRIETILENISKEVEEIKDSRIAIIIEYEFYAQTLQKLTDLGFVSKQVI